MASNNYTQANVVPSSDTFREWVDLTNRITYDMEKRVVTTAMHTVGGGTTGNAYVNGFFSANTLMITDSIQGVSTDDSANTLGANSALANLIFSTNATFIANTTHYSHINAQANVHISGGLLNVDANVDIDNVDTDITATDFTLTGTTANLDSTTTAVNGTTLDINSTTVDIDGTLLDITSTDVNVSGSNVTIDSVNVDIDGTAANLDSTTTNINGTTLDINSATVDVDSATAVNFNSPDVGINGALLDINSTTVDIDNTLTDINSTDVEVRGANVSVYSTQAYIGSNLYVNSVNTTIGFANSQKLTVVANAVLTDKLNVQEAVDFDKTLNVDGNATFNADVTLGNANTDSVNFISEVSSNIIPEANTQALGLDDARWILKANTINAKNDITAQSDVDVSGQTNTNSLRVVTNAIVEGDTILGNLATADVVNVVARVESSIEPTATGKDLGVSARRWDLFANGVNVSNAAIFLSTIDVTGVGTFGNDVDINGEANTGTLRVRSTSELEGFANAQDSFGVIGNTHISGNTYIHHGNTDGLTTISDSNITVGNSHTNTSITPISITTDGTLNVTGDSDLTGTLLVGGAATLENKLDVQGSTNLQSTANVGGLLRAKAGLITTGTANASVAMNVGANVNLSTSKITVGTSSSNTTITKTAIDTDGQLIVAGNTTVGGDVDITGEVNAASAAIVGAAVVGGILDVNNTADFLGNVNFQDSITVADNSTFSKTLAAGNTSITGTITTSGKATLASANVTGALQANGAVDFNSTGDFAGNVNFQDSITVADNSTFSKTLASGNTTVSGFINVSTTSQLDGVVTAGSDVDITGEANSATLRSRGIANVDGLLRAKASAIITGTANVSSVIHVGSANTKVRLANNSIAVGNAAANSKLTSTGISTTGTLTVSNTAALGTTTVTGNASVTGAFDATSANVGGLHSTGAVDLDTTLNVDGATTLNGHIDLGANTSRTVSVTGRVDTSLEPSSTGKVLGHASRRWAAALSTANTSGALNVGTTIEGGNTTVTGFVNATTSGQFGGTLTVGGNTDIDGTHIYLGSNASILSNTSFTTVSTNKIVVANLEVSGSAVLPSDTTLDIAEANTAVLKVRANAEFSTGANVVIGLGSTPSGKATINLTNAHFTNTMSLDHRLQVGTFSSGSSGTQANTTAVESDNIYARNDLIANYSSDKRLKDKVVKIDTALDKVENISGYQFTWNNNIEDYRSGTVDYGVIAQELETILPHAVDINNRGYKTVNYNSLIPLLIEAVKELSGRVKELEKGDEIDG